MAARRAAAAVLTSPGRVVDPVVENATALATNTIGKLRCKWRQMTGNMNSATSLRKLGRVVTGFDEKVFKDQAVTSFRKLVEAHNAGNMSEMKRLTTEQYFGALRRGMEISASTALPSVQLAGMLAEPKILQARLVYMAPAAMRGFNSPPDFAQITVRLESKQMPVAITDRSVLKQVKGRKGGRAAQEAVEWDHAVSVDGHVYYFTPEGFTTWERPVQFGVVGTVPVSLRDVGSVREVVADGEAHADEASEAETSRKGGKRGKRGQQKAAAPERVVSYAVFERALNFPDEWKICHL